MCDARGGGVSFWVVFYWKGAVEKLQSDKFFSPTAVILADVFDLFCLLSVLPANSVF
jgi:hypothetical protein